jgi:hypothetical protein
MTASEKAKKKSLINVVNDDLKRKNSTSSSPNSISSTQNSGIFNVPVNNNYVIEDIVLPFETGSGLFDLFASSNTPSHSNSQTDILGFGGAKNTEMFDKQSMGDKEQNDFGITDIEGFPSPSLNSPKDVDLRYKNNYDLNLDAKFSPIDNELVDNTFPLFSLVGNASFDKNQPLLGIPKDLETNITNNLSMPNRSTSSVNVTSNDNPVPKNSGGMGGEITNTVSNSTLTNPMSNGSKDSSHTIQGDYVAQLQLPNVSNGNLSSNSDTPLTNPFNTPSAGSTTPVKPHQPKPLRPAATVPAMHYQPIRPKRPESVLSVTSNSSSRSFDVNNLNHSFVGLPTSTNSSAFPPSIPKSQMAGDLGTFEKVNSATNISVSENTMTQEEDNLFNPGQIFADTGKMANSFDNFVGFNNYNNLSDNISASNSIDNTFGQQQLDLDDVPFYEIMTPITETKSNTNAGTKYESGY